MTPEEKARELYDKFLQYTPVEFEEEYAKQCAIIAVDEILGTINKLESFAARDYKTEPKIFWKQVKEAIQKL